VKDGTLLCDPCCSALFKAAFFRLGIRFELTSLELIEDSPPNDWICAAGLFAGIGFTSFGRNAAELTVKSSELLAEESSELLLDEEESELLDDESYELMLGGADVSSSTFISDARRLGIFNPKDARIDFLLSSVLVVGKSSPTRFLLL
jgi:hypothetical protein